MNKPFLSSLSLKKRLVYAFISVVVLVSVLSAVVFSYMLVSNFKRSTKDKILETLKVVTSRTDEISRNLETYADLISSDIQFGQALSFDSAYAIESKIHELKEQSHADYVVFIPKPIQYVQIKDEIFSNLEPDRAGRQDIKKWVVKNQYFDGQDVALKGWIEVEQEPVIFAAKAVLYFGTNMGVVFLGKKMTNEFSQNLAEAAGTDIVLLSKEKKVVGSSFLEINYLEKSLESISEDSPESSELVENIAIGQSAYTALISPVKNYDQKNIGRFVLLISDALIRDAQRRTVYSAVIVALLTTILSAFIGIFLANAISNPILSMTKSIQAISEKEDLSIRVKTQSGAEIGILSSAFNSLLGQLQTTTEKLAASEKRMKQELTMASTVQEMLFPEPSVRYGDLVLASYIETSSETGGDWFGYSQDPDSSLVSLLIGDVTGHGMPAALITAITNGFFKGVLKGSDSKNKSSLLNTKKLLRELNQILIESTGKQLLMTFFAGIFDPQTATLHYSNAGHLRPFLCKKKSENDYNVSILPSDPGKRLGEDPEVAYSQQSYVLEPDEVIIMYTDGIIDCANLAGESYGKRRFMNAIKKHIHESPEKMMKNIVSNFNEFLEGAPKVDDVTLVIAKKI